MTIADEIDPRLAPALAWLSSTPRAQRAGAIVLQLQERFGLSLHEATAVCREHHLKLARAD